MRCCHIFRRERRSKIDITGASWGSLSCRSLSRLDKTRRQKSIGRRTPLLLRWSYCILVDVVVEIYLDAGNPSICQLPFSEDRRPADLAVDCVVHGCRHRHVSRLISTKRRARPFASHHPLIDDHATIQSTPFHSMHRSPPGLLVADDNSDECRQVPCSLPRVPWSVHVIYHVSSCVTERICLVVPSVDVDDWRTSPQCLVAAPLWQIVADKGSTTAAAGCWIIARRSTIDQTTDIVANAPTTRFLRDELKSVAAPAAAIKIWLIAREAFLCVRI